MELFEKKENAPAAQTEVAIVKLPDLSIFTPEKITEVHKIMNDKVMRACAALSKITAIETDEDDKKAETLLVKVRNTYDETNALRTPYTALTDDLKRILMEPEKRIAIKAGSPGSEYIRVKTLRDQRAVKLANEAEVKRKAAEDLQNEKDEIVRIKGMFENHFFVKTLELLAGMDDSIAKYLTTMTLENWDSKQAIFSVTPKIKQDVFDSWFVVEYDGLKLSKVKFDELLVEVKEKMTYEKVNTIYQEKAILKVNEWKGKLPARKKELEEIAELEKTNAAAAVERQKEIDAKNATDEKNRATALEQQKSEKAAEVQQAVQGAQLDNAFEAQVATQAAGSGKSTGTRKKRVSVITAPDNKIVEVMAKVMFACFTNAKFKGHVKKDGEGKPLVDVNGIPQYQDWAAELLDFVAQNTDVKIEGIEFKEIISTTARKA